MPYLFIRVAVEHVTPSVLVCLRTAIACLVLLPMAVHGRMLGRVLGRWRRVLAFAVIEIVVPFGLLSWAELRLPSSLTGLLVAAVPLMAAAAGVLLRLPDRIRLGSATDPRRLLGPVVGLAGVGALVGSDRRGGDVVAGLAVRGAAFGYALGPVIAASRLADLPRLGVTVVANGVAALVYLPSTAVQWPREPVPWSAWAAI